MKFAVAFLNLYDSDWSLKLKIIEANNWKEAFEKAFPDYAPHLLGETMDEAQGSAADQEWIFNVVEIN